MEKPHYKQPITGENIETALTFYFESFGLKYSLGGIDQCKRIAERLATLKEVKSMYNIEALLEDGLRYFPDAITKGVKSRISYKPTQCQILDYLLAANYTKWERFHGAIVAKEIVNYLIKVKFENDKTKVK